MSIKQLKELLDIASGGNDNRTVIVYKKETRAFGLRKDEVKDVRSEHPQIVLIEI